MTMVSGKAGQAPIELQKFPGCQALTQRTSLFGTMTVS